LTPAYAFLMSIARRDPQGRREPLHAPDVLERYEGLWVAVTDDKVIAAAPTSRELVYALAKIGPDAKGATMQRVPSANSGLVVGVG